MPDVFTSYAHFEHSRVLAIEIDDNVHKALELIENSHIPPDKWVAITEQVAKLAPLLWGHYNRKEVAHPALHRESIQAKYEKAQLKKKQETEPSV